jgi:hypothetical protein
MTAKPALRRGLIAANDGFSGGDRSAGIFDFLKRNKRTTNPEKITMMTVIDLRSDAAPDGGVTLRTVFQAPAILSSGALPFTASDGTIVAASPHGYPFVSAIDGRVTVFLRTGECPLRSWNRDTVSRMSGAESARQTVAAIHKAVRELRAALQPRMRRGV